MTRRGVYAAALVVAAAVDVVQHRPAVPTYCHAGRRCRGGRGQLTYCRVKPSQRLHPHRYYVGYAGLSTFDRTLVDIRATQNQYDARMARPDNCTFTVGKNKQRGVADHQPNAPAGRVYMRHFRSLP